MKIFLIALVALFGFGTLASAFGTFGVEVVTLVGIAQVLVAIFGFDIVAATVCSVYRTLREPPLGQVLVGLEGAPLGLV